MTRGYYQITYDEMFIQSLIHKKNDNFVQKIFAMRVYILPDQLNNLGLGLVDKLWCIRITTKESLQYMRKYTAQGQNKRNDKKYVDGKASVMQSCTYNRNRCLAMVRKRFDILCYP